MTQTTGEEREYLVELGMVIVEWNKLEATIRFLIYKLAGGGPATDILLSKMSTLGTIDIFKSLSGEIGSDSLRSELGHLAEVYDKLREYRNEYVHGIAALVHDGSINGPIVGLGQTVATSKSRLVLREHKVSKADLEFMRTNLESAKKYADSIITTLLREISPDCRRLLPAVDIVRPTDLKRLTRHHTFLYDAGGDDSQMQGKYTNTSAKD